MVNKKSDSISRRAMIISGSGLLGVATGSYLLKNSTEVEAMSISPKLNISDVFVSTADGVLQDFSITYDVLDISYINLTDPSNVSFDVETRIIAEGVNEQLNFEEVEAQNQPHDTISPSFKNTTTSVFNTTSLDPQDFEVTEDGKQETTPIDIVLSVEVNGVEQLNNDEVTDSFELVVTNKEAESSSTIEATSDAEPKL